MFSAVRQASLLWFVFSLAARAQDYTLVSKLLDAERAKRKIPGYSAAIYHHGEIVWVRAAGLADLKTSRPVRRDTPFRIASITKPITSAALLYLFEQRQLQLTDDVRKYCPAYPAKPYPMSLGQLLGHLGGVRHYAGPDDMNNITRFATVTDSLRKFSADPLVHSPGSRYLYSTYGYSLLGCAIEGASRMTYEHWLEDKIFATVGMCSTALDNGRGLSSRRAMGYRRNAAGDIEESAYNDNTGKLPGGGLVSTPEDLLRFAEGLFRERLLRRETIDLMWTSGRAASGKLTGYGLGWSLSTAPGGGREVYHTGGQQGASTILYLRPEQRFAFVWLTNLQNLEERLPVAREVFRLVAEK
jgi:CubicO group peptidase (beta-lactamase class C family)